MKLCLWTGTDLVSVLVVTPGACWCEGRMDVASSFLSFNSQLTMAKLQESDGRTCYAIP